MPANNAALRQTWVWTSIFSDLERLSPAKWGASRTYNPEDGRSYFATSR